MALSLPFTSSHFTSCYPMRSLDRMHFLVQCSGVFWPRRCVKLTISLLDFTKDKNKQWLLAGFWKMASLICVKELPSWISVCYRCLSSRWPAHPLSHPGLDSAWNSGRGLNGKAWEPSAAEWMPVGEPKKWIAHAFAQLTDAILIVTGTVCQLHHEFHD